MAKPRYDDLVAWLRSEYGDDLRWTASFNHRTYQYRVRYIRDDLKTELTGNELDTIVHRSLAVFNRRHVEDVYFHLGDAKGLVVSHERATAVHFYIDVERGVVVKLQPDAEVTVPTFLTECRRRLDPDGGD